MENTHVLVSLTWYFVVVLQSSRTQINPYAGHLIYKKIRIQNRKVNSYKRVFLYYYEMSKYTEKDRQLDYVKYTCYFNFYQLCKENINIIHMHYF